MRMLLLTLCCLSMSSGIVLAQTHVPGPGTSPSPGPTNPSLPNVSQVPPKGVASGSRGLTGNDDVRLPNTPEEAGSPPGVKKHGMK
jgi:hypothetical protein